MSNSMNWLLWLPAVSALMFLVSLVSMLAYAALAKSDGSSAKKYAIVGLSIMLFSRDRGTRHSGCRRSIHRHRNRDDGCLGKRCRLYAVPCGCNGVLGRGSVYGT